MITSPTRRLGARGPLVSRWGLGLAALGRPAYHNLQHGEDLQGQWQPEPLERHCHLMLNAAWAAGIRYLDVARSYGEGERFLQRWLQAHPELHGQPVIGSKWGYTYTGGWSLDAPVHERKDHGLLTFQRQVAESTATLGNALSVYCIHSASLASGVLDDQEVLDAMAQWRAQTGRQIGLTATGPRQSDTLRAVLDRFPEQFDVVHATFNLLEPSVGPALQECHDAGIGVIVKEGVANGRLTARTDLPSVRDHLFPAARRLKTSPDALALAWILHHPAVDVVLSGATTVEQLHSNLAADRLEIDPDTTHRLEQLTLPPERYWELRSALAWT